MVIARMGVSSADKEKLRGASGLEGKRTSLDMLNLSFHPESWSCG